VAGGRLGNSKLDYLQSTSLGGVSKKRGKMYISEELPPFSCFADGNGKKGEGKKNWG